MPASRRTAEGEETHAWQDGPSGVREFAQADGASFLLSLVLGGLPGVVADAAGGYRGNTAGRVKEGGAGVTTEINCKMKGVVWAASSKVRC